MAKRYFLVNNSGYTYHENRAGFGPIRIEPGDRVEAASKEEADSIAMDCEGQIAVEAVVDDDDVIVAVEENKPKESSRHGTGRSRK